MTLRSWFKLDGLVRRRAEKIRSRMISRVTLIVLGMSFSALAFAQTEFGTKKDLVLPETKSFSTGPGMMPILQMLLAVGVVIGLLKFALPRLMPLMNKRMNARLGSSIRIEETASFAAGTLYIVQAKSRTLLLSCTQQGVSCLADLTESPAPVAQPTVASAPAPSPEPAFFELVDAAQEKSPTLLSAVVHTPYEDDDEADFATSRAAAPAAFRDLNRDQIESALSRLRRLTG